MFERFIRHVFKDPSGQFVSNSGLTKAFSDPATIEVCDRSQVPLPRLPKLGALPIADHVDAGAARRWTSSSSQEPDATNNLAHNPPQKSSIRWTNLCLLKVTRSEGAGRTSLIRGSGALSCMATMVMRPTSEKDDGLRHNAI